MRILGADSFVGRSTSLNAIPRNVLRKHDLCIVKISTDSADYAQAIYFMEYMTNDGNPENIPYVVIPMDNLDINVNTGAVADDGGRWKLKNIFMSRLFVEDLVTNNIVPATPGVPIIIGDTLSIGLDGITVDGQVIINNDVTEAPLVVNSSVMVDNLNAEYLHGYSYDKFMMNQSYDTVIPDGVTEFDVYFPYPIMAPEHYAIMMDICNLVDTDPSIYSYMITKKESDHFTVKFSGIIDSPNYTLHYIIIGELDYTASPPSGSPPSGGF